MRLRVFFGVLLIVFSSWVAADESSVGAARQVVDKLNVALIDVMKNAKTLGFQGRKKRLDSVVRSTHEFNAIAHIALGAYWKELSDDQRNAFVERLTELGVATYAAQFNGYSGEEFQYETAQTVKNRVRLVYRLEAPKESAVRFEYLVSPFGGDWAISDIVVDGISDLALKKSQYAHVLDQDGFSALMKKLDQKLNDYNNSKS
jgi:phospholipid transport system substrate-binding protein